MALVSAHPLRLSKQYGLCGYGALYVKKFEGPLMTCSRKCNLSHRHLGAMLQMSSIYLKRHLLGPAGHRSEHLLARSHFLFLRSDYTAVHRRVAAVEARDD